MRSAKQTAVVICPGRGTYNKPELGVLGRHFTDKALLAHFDDMRRAQGQETLSELDIPMLTVDCDIVDPTVTSEEEVTGKIEQFFELLEDR